MSRNSKQNIIESWIMVEHLSEGDISKNMISPEDKPWTEQFDEYIVSSKIGSKGGVILYCDVFEFNLVKEILRKEYGLKSSEDECYTGSKFGFTLVFDKDLNPLLDKIFVTYSYIILRNSKIIRQDEFEKAESSFIQNISQIFEKNDDINESIDNVLAVYGVSRDSCCYKVINNVESETTNLHSFFIRDLEKAGKLNNDNINQYLFGNSNGKVNLDSRKDSATCNQRVFDRILEPKNYPVGRFPSNPEYAQSFMQQVAINLAIGLDSNQMRSVNGPPGTGKTTLLKDIFAELVIQQATEIIGMSSKKMIGGAANEYFNTATIGALPGSISERNIVVCSSNNGAVKNIVDELPLWSGISEEFKDQLLEVDYFREISNSTVEVKWEPNEKGVKKPHCIAIPNDDCDKNWGLFSLEGGRSENMYSIDSYLKIVCKELEESYESNPDVYSDFKKQLEKVTELKNKTQKMKVDYSNLVARQNEYAYAKYCYDNEYTSRKKAVDDKISQCNQAIEASKKAIADCEDNKRQINEDRTSTEKMRDQAQFDLSRLKKPCFLSGRAKKVAYQNEYNRLLNLRNNYNSDIEAFMTQRVGFDSQIRNNESLISQNENSKLNHITEFNNWVNVLKTKEASCVKASNEFKQAYPNIRIASPGTKDADITDISIRNCDYDSLHLSNPWFDKHYRNEQTKLFILALACRKQFLYENVKNVKAALVIWGKAKSYIDDKKHLIPIAWNWINFAIPVISSTFASIQNMCQYLGEGSIGHLFIDEAGQALPQAAVGAIWRSRHVMAVGDPAQIKPVLTVDDNILSMLRTKFDVDETYLSDSASVQTLMDEASTFGFFKKGPDNPESWIGIPLWVHRRCCYPMFNISNRISYGDMMVQGKPKYGKTCWYDVNGKAKDKFVKEQGDFLAEKILEISKVNSAVFDKDSKDEIYIITPFKNVAYQLAERLKKIRFTRYDDNRKPTNIGTVHTFQGKEAPIVFLVLGADEDSKGAATWAVSEPNMMNVAATRAKEEFYVIGSRKLYEQIGTETISETISIIDGYVGSEENQD